MFQQSDERGPRYVIGIEHSGSWVCLRREDDGYSQTLIAEGQRISPGKAPIIIGVDCDVRDVMVETGCQHATEKISYILFCVRCSINPEDCGHGVDHEMRVMYPPRLS